MKNLKYYYIDMDCNLDEFGTPARLAVRKFKK